MQHSVSRCCARAEGSVREGKTEQRECMYGGHSSGGRALTREGRGEEREEEWREGEEEKKRAEEGKE